MTTTGLILLIYHNLQVKILCSLFAITVLLAMGRIGLLTISEYMGARARWSFVTFFHYNIYQDGVQIGTTVYDETEYVVEGLDNGTEYCFSVQQHMEKASLHYRQRFVLLPWALFKLAQPQSILIY